MKSLIENGAAPSDVSFVLSSLATELGLKVTDGSISVFPVVMTGIIHAVSEAMEESVDDDETNEEEMPGGATLH